MNIENLIVGIENSNVIVKYGLCDFFAYKYLTHNDFYEYINRYLKKNGHNTKTFHFINEGGRLT